MNTEWKMCFYWAVVAVMEPSVPNGAKKTFKQGWFQPLATRIPADRDMEMIADA